MSKFLLLGLDGATFEMLDPMIETGRLPVLQRLLTRGARGVLTSTMPPYTCPAWPCMYTGRNPGAHGVTSFRLIEPGSVEGHAATLRDVTAPRLWTVLNQAGLRTGIFNVPVTYPAEEIDGFMVSGFVTPPGAPRGVKPDSLAKAFAESMSEYDFNGPTAGEGKWGARHLRQEYMKSLENALIQRGKTLEWLLKRKPVDFLWVVLEAIDRISHKAYGYLAPCSPIYHTDIAKEVREQTLCVLETQDRVIERILELMDDPTVLVVSDHGFSRPLYQFDLCAYLVDRALMVPAAGTQTRARFRKGVRAAVTKTMGYRSWVRLVRLVQRFRGASSERPESQQWDAAQQKACDWCHSKTWLGPHMEYGVRLNRTGDGPGRVTDDAAADEVAEAVVEALQTARNPETGQALFDVVDRRERLYAGPHVNRTPDVLFIPNRTIIHAHRPVAGATERNGWRAPLPNELGIGYHDANGVFAASGPPFYQTKVSGAQIVDIVPTVLHTLGVAPLPELEGRVIKEAFSTDFVAKQTPRSAPGPAEVSDDTELPSYSPEEEEAIRLRLEDLGYL